MSASLIFLAQLAERSGFSRDQDGATVRLHVYETEVPAAIGLAALNKCVLRVTVEVVDANSIAGAMIARRPARRQAGRAIEKQ